MVYKKRKVNFKNVIQAMTSNDIDNENQEFRREGWTEAAIILCKLNKSL